MTLTRDELASSPLLYDQGELDNQNWGQLTFTFEHRRFIDGQVNAEATYTGSGAYRVEDDLLYHRLGQR